MGRVQVKQKNSSAKHTLIMEKVVDFDGINHLT
jgi:hypothetical protein